MVLARGLGPGIEAIHPTVLDAGSADQINVIPATARVKLDVRTIPGVDHAALIARVGELATQAGEPFGVDAAIEVIDDRPAVEFDPEHDAVIFDEAHEMEAVASDYFAELGAEPPYGGVPGATDGTILTRDAGIPTVVYGPGGKWIAHQADEYVEVEELGQYARVYARAARAFLSGERG